ncbi:pyroglutamyl-peptidase I [Streptomyces sp. NPDC059740]|uniref:pyroglutamyl-peptidase I n=1 Tax=Streptomyces sp. NPDC059740 TaxID=3346926 RepID=UPI003667CE2F
MTATVLLTGFEPFGGDALNPSWEAVRAAAAEPLPGAELHAVRLPCVHAEVGAALRQAVEEHRPDLVLCTGLAGGRPDVTVERIAVNLADARIPDNSGAQPLDEPVVAGGPAAYFAPLPVKACVAAARAAGVPASVSHTAGTFVCNHAFYTLAHLIATERPALRGGFVHVPYASEQVTGTGQPSLPVALVAEGLRAIVTAALTTTEDLRTVGGALH